MAEHPPEPTQDETIVEILARSKREAVPIRKTFVQQGVGKVRDPGPLSALLTTRNVRALDLYLLVHAIASKEPFDVALAGAVWARAIGLPANESSATAVSKAFRRLEQLNLITRTRKGNTTKVTLLDEGGRGQPYAPPYTSEKSDRYLKLPHHYWVGGWYRHLSAPAKVMLLIALSLDDGFVLPIEKGKDWYGISGDSVQRGLAEIREMEILNAEVGYKKAPLAPLGYTQDWHYTLRPPFGPMRSRLATVIDLVPKAKDHG